MSDFYEEEGWTMLVSTPRMGGGKPMLEQYTVAIKSRADAEAFVRNLVGAGPSIIDASSITPSLMKTYSLFPGKFVVHPVANG